MVREEITKRHYFTEEELVFLLQLPEKCTLERIAEIGPLDIDTDQELKNYKVIVTTIETVELSDPE